MMKLVVGFLLGVCVGSLVVGLLSEETQSISPEKETPPAEKVTDATEIVAPAGADLELTLPDTPQPSIAPISTAPFKSDEAERKVAVLESQVAELKATAKANEVALLVGQRSLRHTRPVMGMTKEETAQVSIWIRDAQAELTQSKLRHIKTKEGFDAAITAWRKDKGPVIEARVAKLIGRKRLGVMQNKLEEVRAEYEQVITFIKKAPREHQLWSMLCAAGGEK